MTKYCCKGDNCNSVQIRLVGDNLSELGIESTVYSVPDSETIANDLELDLICKSQSEGTCICILGNYEKIQYAEKKASKVKPPELKEVQINHNIGLRDLDTKINQIKDFLFKWHPVKVVFKYKTKREAFQYQKELPALMDKIKVAIQAYGVAQVKTEGARQILNVSPKKNK